MMTRRSGGALPTSGLSERERLLAKVSKDPNTGCWNWTGALQANGYASMRVQRGEARAGWRTTSGHRLAFELYRGPIPEGMELDHLCRNRRCVNPDHLEVVDRATNTLRGDAPALIGALNASKTHCNSGHEFTAANTYQRPDGGRTCRMCARLRARERRKGGD